MNVPCERREPDNGFPWMLRGSQPMNARRSFNGACLPLLNSDRSMLTTVGEIWVRRNTIETEKKDLI
jgi:hypothetical protein